MPFKGRERRLRTRFRIRVPFVLITNGQEVHGITRNISLLGISAYSEAPVAHVQPVQCHLALPQSHSPIIAQGTVIRCAPLVQPHPDGSYEIGVFFKGFQATGEAVLTKFLDRKAREERVALKAGFQALKQKLVQRRRRKQREALQKRRRRAQRLQRKRLRLAKQKLLKAQRRRKQLKVRARRSPEVRQEQTV